MQMFLKLKKKNNFKNNIIFKISLNQSHEGF